jgi:hypothetical protein
MNDSPRGIVHSADDGTLAHLPLIKAIINVQLVDSKHITIRHPFTTFLQHLTYITVSTCVTLRQEFANPSNTATSRAKYVFPVPARAAVCAFEMRFAGGRVIVGVAKEKAQALEEYENAVRAGKSSALVEWVTDDCESFYQPSTTGGVKKLPFSIHGLSRLHSSKADSDHEDRICNDPHRRRAHGSSAPTAAYVRR